MPSLRKNILITGASSGLGAGMARLFAQQGRHLVLCARRREKLEALQAELLQRYPNIRVRIEALDVNDHAQVFEVFHRCAQAWAGLDRIIVNAGMGKGQPIGSGSELFYKANLATAQTNFIAALAQCEAAMEIFWQQKSGHLVTMSSMSAMRGLPGNLTVYAATKAGLAALTEGIRADCVKKNLPIAVTTLFPGYIRTEINSKLKNTPFMIETEVGCQALVKAIEQEPSTACVPNWPWRLIGWYMRHAPLKWLAKSN